MAADVQRHVETQFTIADRATGQLNKMGGAAQRVTGLFDKASSVVGKFGGIVSAVIGDLSVGAAVVGAQQYLKTVRDISQATGVAASSTDAMLEAMFTVNIAAEEGGMLIQRMSLSMQRYQAEVARAGKATSEAALIIQRLGIETEKGPEAAMVRMSKLAEKQKLQIYDLVVGFQLEERSAASLMRLLEKGPKHLAGIMDGLKKRGIAVTATNIEAFERFEAAQLSIKSAWDRIFIVIASRVMPAISKLMEGVAARIDSWSEKAAWFGEVLGKVLDKHLGTIVTIGKIFSANFAIMKLTGVGLGGMAGKLLMGKAAGGAMAGGLLTGGAATMAPLLAGIVAATVVVAAGFVAIRDNFEGVRDEIVAMWNRVLGATKVLRAQVEGIIGPLDFVFSRDSALGRFVMLLLPRAMTYVLEQIEQSILTVAVLVDFGKKLYDQSVYLFDLIGNSASRVFGLIVTYFKTTLLEPLVKGWTIIRDIVVRYVFNPWIKLFSAIYDLVRPLLEAVGKAAEAAPKIPSFLDLLSAPMDMLQESWDKIMAQAKADAVAAQAERRIKKREPPPERQPPPVMDFRGSTFNIKQAFAEGFDPDRIAVAFSNDLATLGERRLQATTAPLFAIR